MLSLHLCKSYINLIFLSGYITARNVSLLCSGVIRCFENTSCVRSEKAASRLHQAGGMEPSPLEEMNLTLFIQCVLISASAPHGAVLLPPYRRSEQLQTTKMQRGGVIFGHAVLSQ
jgi:hypothetical protein